MVMTPKSAEFCSFSTMVCPRPPAGAVPCPSTTRERLERSAARRHPQGCGQHPVAALIRSRHNTRCRMFAPFPVIRGLWITRRAPALGVSRIASARPQGTGAREQVSRKRGGGGGGRALKATWGLPPLRVPTPSSPRSESYCLRPTKNFARSHLEHLRSSQKFAESKI